MHLESLKIFCDIVRWASFSRGAAENGISQSSASQVVQRIEDHLGVRLIDRSTRPFVLTPRGRLYYEGCKEIVGRYLELEGRIRSPDDDSRLVGSVRVASIYSVGLAHISRYVRTFTQTHPDVEVRVEYLHPTRVVESVSRGVAELGLISFPKRWPDLVALPWRDEPMVVALPKLHPLAGRKSIDVHELDGEKFVSFDPELSIRRAIDRFLKRYGVSAEIVLEFDNIENIKRAVEAEAGVAILPEPTLAHERLAGTLAVVPFAEGPPSRPLAIIHRRGGPSGRPARCFLEWLQAEPAPEPAHLAHEAAGTTP